MKIEAVFAKLKMNYKCNINFLQNSFLGIQHILVKFLLVKASQKILFSYDVKKFQAIVSIVSDHTLYTEVKSAIS